MKNKLVKFWLFINKEWNNFVDKINPRIIYAEYYYPVLTVTYSDNKKSKYEGNGTVWRQLPIMNRSNNEYALSEIYIYIHRYGNPYPTAHLKGKTNR